MLVRVDTPSTDHALRGCCMICMMSNVVFVRERRSIDGSQEAVRCVQCPDTVVCLQRQSQRGAHGHADKVVCAVLIGGPLWTSVLSCSKLFLQALPHHFDGCSCSLSTRARASSRCVPLHPSLALLECPLTFIRRCCRVVPRLVPSVVPLSHDAQHRDGMGRNGTE